MAGKVCKNLHELSPVEAGLDVCTQNVQSRSNVPFLNVGADRK